MSRKLPPLKIFIATLRLVAEKWSFGLKIGWPLILFSALVGLCVDLGLVPQPEPVLAKDDPLDAGEITVGEGWEDFLVIVLLTLLSSFPAIFWHRSILRHEDHAPELPFRFDAILWRFIGYTLALTLLGVSAFVLLFALLFVLAIFIPALEFWNWEYPWYVTALFLLFALFFVARAGLALPAAAIGNRGFGIIASWRATRGNSWRILLLQALSILLMVLIGFVWLRASSGIVTIAGDIPYAVGYLGNGVYQLFVVFLEVGLFSFTYAWLVEEKDLPGW